MQEGKVLWGDPDLVSGGQGVLNRWDSQHKPGHVLSQTNHFKWLISCMWHRHHQVWRQDERIRCMICPGSCSYVIRNWNLWLCMSRTFTKTKLDTLANHVHPRTWNNTFWTTAWLLWYIKASGSKNLYSDALIWEASNDNRTSLVRGCWNICVDMWNLCQVYPTCPHLQTFSGSSFWRLL